MIKIENKIKYKIAKFGANKLFIKEYKEREKMDEQQLIILFDTVWSKTLEELVLKAKKCPVEEVYNRLLDEKHSFIDPKQEHRSFHYKKAEFIVQLEIYKHEKFQYRLTDLWRVTSSDSYPQTLFINFSSVEEKNLFKSLAEKLNFRDEELGLKLIYNFMNLHSGYEITKEKEE